MVWVQSHRRPVLLFCWRREGKELSFLDRERTRKPRLVGGELHNFTCCGMEGGIVCI